MGYKTTLSRRDYLTAIALSVPITSGCLFKSDTEPEVSGIRGLIISNRYTDEIQIEISITRDDNTIFKEEFELAGRESIDIEEAWTESGDYEITATATLGDSTITQSASPVPMDPDEEMGHCMQVNIRSNEIMIHQALHDNPCEANRFAE